MTDAGLDAHSGRDSVGRRTLAVVAVLSLLPLALVAEAPPVAASVPAYSTAVAADSPLHYWRLAETGSPAGDSGSGSRTCSGSGSPTFSAAGLLETDTNTAVSFDGTNYLNCGSFAMSGTTGSIEAWVELDSLPTDSGLIAGTSYFGLRVLDGKPEFLARTTASSFPRVATAASPIAAGGVHHVVGTFSAGAMSLYVDGVLTGTASRSGTLGGSKVFGIASDPATPGAELDGTVDEVALYTTALSGARVLDHFEAGVGEFAEPQSDSYSDAVALDSPVRHWRLGDAAGEPVVGTGGVCRALPGAAMGSGGLLATSSDSAAAFSTEGPHIDCGMFGWSSQSAASIEAWVSLDAVPGASEIVTIAGTPHFELRLNGDRPEFGVRTDRSAYTTYSTSLTPISAGEVHHLVGAYAEGEMRLYIDGVESVFKIKQGNLVASGVLWIGAAAGQTLEGTVDEVAVYPAQLALSEVVDHFEAGAGEVPSPASDAYSTTIESDSPVEYWRLGDQPGGPVAGADRLCRAVSGVTMGSAGLLDASGDTAARFDGSGAPIDCGPLDLDGESEVSIEARVNLDSIPTSPSIANIAGTDRLGLRMNGATPEFVLFTSYSGSTPKVLSAATSLNVGSSYHLAGTFTHGAMRLYINGVQSSSTIFHGTLTGPLPFWIGAAASDPAKALDGTIDEVAVFDTELDPQRVSEHAAGGGRVLSGGAMTIEEARAGGSRSICTPVDQKTDDPVSVPFGEFWHRFESFTFPGRGVPLTLEHSYSSSRAGIDGPLGYGWAMSYPSMSLSEDPGTGRVTLVEENATEIAFDPDPGNPGEYVATKQRCVATLGENGDGTWTFTRPNRAEVFTFDTDGKLTEMGSLIGDPDEVTTLAYNGSDQLEVVTDPAGRTLTFTWASGRIEQVTDSSSPARSVSFDYDANGDLIEWSDVAGSSWAFTYDGSHRLLTMRDPNQHGVPSPPVVSNTYDGSGRVTAQSDRLNRTTTFDYSSVADSVIVTDPEGRDELTRYSDGLPVSITRAYGTASAATTRLFYDPEVGLVTDVLDPNGHWTHASYNDAGKRTGTVDALGRTTSATYTALGQPLSTTDGEGITTTYTYNANNTIASVSTPLAGSSPAVSATVSYTYGDSSHPGDVTSVTDARGKVTDIGYDSDGNIDSVTDPEGNETTTVFNHQGWPSQVVSPRGNAVGGTPADHRTSYTYDAHGDVLTATDPLGGVTTNTYDDNRNLVAAENPNLNTTTYHYDAEDQLVETQRADSTEVSTSFHDDGQVHTQTDGAGAVTTYLYDDLGRLASMSDPLTNVTAYGYDPVGNLTALQQPGGNCFASPATGCITQSFDAANQLESVTYSDGTTPNITGIDYDDNGRRTQVDYGAAQISTWAYDSLGRLTSSGDGTTVEYGYDLAGNVTSIVYPGDLTLTRGYDDAGRLTSSTDWTTNTTTFGYDEDSNLISIDYPTGDQTDTFTFDRADRIDAIEMTAGATTLAELDYTRDNNGQVTGEDLTGLPGSDHTWGYDTLERLTTQDTTPTWAYDNADNPTTLDTTHQVFNTAYQVCSTAPTAGTCTTPATGATTYAYDSRSNLTTITPPAPTTATALTYDQANRLTAHGNANATYGYNADGLRTTKTVASTTTTFTWDKIGELPMLLTETGSGDDTHYLYGPGSLPYAQIGPTGTITYLHHDQLGSTRLLTNAAGTVSGTASYTPYGEPAATTGTITPFGYAGQYTDHETGYQYLRARYYNPTTAQFITKDPASAGTRDPHGYSWSNPLNLTDPSGLWPWDGMCVAGINCPGTGERPIGEIWASEHPEAAQQAIDFLSGVSSVNPVTIATDALGLTDTSAGACTTSGWYRAGQASMFVVDAWMGVGTQATRLRNSSMFGKSSFLFGRGGKAGGGLLNRTPIRVGWGWKGPWDTGQDVFRIGVGHRQWHLDIWEVGRAIRG